MYWTRFQDCSYTLNSDFRTTFREWNGLAKCRTKYEKNTELLPFFDRGLYFFVSECLSLFKTCFTLKIQAINPVAPRTIRWQEIKINALQAIGYWKGSIKLKEKWISQSTSQQWSNCNIIAMFRQIKTSCHVMI